MPITYNKLTITKYYNKLMIFGSEFVMLLLLLFSFSFWLVDLARTVILLCENWLSTYMEILYTYPEIYGG